MIKGASILWIISFLPFISVKANYFNEKREVATGYEGKLFQIVNDNGWKYLEVYEAALNKDIIIITRIRKKGTTLAGNTETGKVGDKVNETLIRFEKGVDGTLFIRKLYGQIQTSNDADLQLAVNNASLQPFVAAFKQNSPKSIQGKGVYDITTYLEDGSNVFFFSPYYKSALKLGAYQRDKSFIDRVYNVDKGVDIHTTQTFYNPDGFSTLEITATIMLLAENVMHPRYADPRVGYFTQTKQEYKISQSENGEKKMITRWRMEPRDEDIEKYKRGELIEPKQPIVFYIDRATPKQWIPYLMAGVNDWQAAFEKAGFKNAIYAKLAPERKEDSTWDIASSRYSNIVYVATETEDASYSTVVDPRSGEIIQSDIRWYHGIMKKLHDRYFVQASPNDPRARQAEYDDKLMGALIRNTCAHEIGHALGFPHNFGASFSIPVDSLRNKNWIEANGHTPSIMDYSRFNYVAQPEDKINESGLFHYVGRYDRWAIEWGYRYIFDTIHEKDILNKWILSREVDKQCWYGADDKYTDPRCQYEDLSNDVLKADVYGIKNLQFIMLHLNVWCNGIINKPENLKDLYDLVVQQYWKYMTHASNYIGGVYETNGENGVIFSKVPKEKQVEALEFLNKYLFKEPEWLLKSEILNRTGDDPLIVISKIYSNILGLIMSNETLKRLAFNSAANAPGYPAIQLAKDVREKVWTELNSLHPINPYRRLLQNIYVDKWINKIQQPFINRIKDPVISEWSMLASGELKRLEKRIRKSIPAFKDEVSIYHLQDVLMRIQAALKSDN